MRYVCDVCVCMYVACVNLYTCVFIYVCACVCSKGKHLAYTVCFTYEIKGKSYLRCGTQLGYMTHMYCPTIEALEYHIQCEELLIFRDSKYTCISIIRDRIVMCHFWTLLMDSNWSPRRNAPCRNSVNVRFHS